MTNTEQAIKYIFGLAVAAAVALSGWNIQTTADNTSRVGVLEERSAGVASRLARIEDKIDWLVQEQVKVYDRDDAPVRPRIRQSP